MQEHEFDSFDGGHDFNAFDSDDEIETFGCDHAVTTVRCGLFFSDQYKPKSQIEFREHLRKDFPNERRRPEGTRANGVEGFRPRRAYLHKDDATTVVWQQGSAVYLQSEGSYIRDKFLKALESVVQACAATRRVNVEPLTLEVNIVHRFEFSPYEYEQFELHRYFTILPQPSPEIRRLGVFLLQNEINLSYADYGGELIELALKTPVNRKNGCVELTINSHNPFVPTMEDTITSVNKELDSIEELTFDATTKELHQLLDWI